MFCEHACISRNVYVFAFILPVASEVSVSNDEDLPEAKKPSNWWKYIAIRKVRHPLKSPRDCKTKKLRNFAKKCGLKVVPGGKHWMVYGRKTLLTIIPHKLKGKGTCIAIIKKLNRRCT